MRRLTLKLGGSRSCFFSVWEECWIGAGRFDIAFEDYKMFFLLMPNIIWHQISKERA
ncbi:hypothetical protein BPUTEOMOX_2469 [methanotrophic endosymbiont of Bathymodiolus puteoserpentis (Logatchev)]|nr:hypothetical protein BPUTEOMOX_2469 [methanotrophic endosymbiont of Bathymodiolus puteoserpentis (Logatchev)]